MDGKYVLACVCVVCLTVIGCMAIHYGVDGTLYLTVVGVVGGVFGAAVAQKVYNVVVKGDDGK